MSEPNERDPVAEAIARAKPMTGADLERVCEALKDFDPADLHDPSKWLSTDEFMTSLAAHPGAPVEMRPEEVEHVRAVVEIFKKTRGSAQGDRVKRLLVNIVPRLLADNARLRTALDGARSQVSALIAERDRA